MTLNLLEGLNFMARVCYNSGSTPNQRKGYYLLDSISTRNSIDYSSWGPKYTFINILTYT